MVMLEYDFVKVDCNSAMWQNGKKNIKYNKTIEKKTNINVRIYITTMQLLQSNLTLNVVVVLLCNSWTPKTIAVSRF